MKYRIIENTGSPKGFYIQEKKKRWFSKKHYWKAVYEPYDYRNKLVIFDSEKEAEYWINSKTETVTTNNR